MSGNDDETDGRPSGAEVKKFAAAGRGKACPTCGSPVKKEFRPFCSRRCAELDLGRWFREDYRIPAEEPPEGDEQTESDGGEPA